MRKYVCVRAYARGVCGKRGPLGPLIRLVGLIGLHSLACTYLFLHDIVLMLVCVHSHARTIVYNNP